MKLAITDACIFIDLVELKLLSAFFTLPLEVHTSIDVINELRLEQQEFLHAYIIVKKLVVHNISGEERKEIINASYPKTLSLTDKTVIFLAAKLKAIVLSSDKAVRRLAKSNSIGYHGMFWIFDELLKNSLITPITAIDKINKLFYLNFYYQDNLELLKEKEKRILQWKKFK